MSSSPLPPSAPSTSADIERWRGEVLRLRAMIGSLESQRKSLIWFVKVGAVVALPTAYFHLLAPVGVFVFALIVYFTGQYFSWGHLVDRRQQLRDAHALLRGARRKAGLPEEDETLRPAPAAPTTDDASQ